MVGEVLLSTEAFATNLAPKRIFICMGALMIG